MSESNGKSETPEKASKKKTTRAAKPAAARAPKAPTTKTTVLVDAPARQGDSSVRVTFAPEASKKAPSAKGRVPSEERKRLIAVRAYSKAVQRGFKAGNPRTDWLEAEREIDSELVGDTLSRR